MDTIAPQDLKAIAQLDIAGLMQAAQMLDKKDQQLIALAFSKLAKKAAAVPKAPRRRNAVVPAPPSPQAVTKMTDEQKFFARCAGLQDNVTQNQRLWHSNGALLMPPQMQIDTTMIPNDAAGNFKPQLQLTFLALQYLRMTTEAHAAAQTMSCYTACCVGQTLEQLRKWWTDMGRHAEKFPDWLQDNIVGSPLGKLTPKQIYSYVSLAHLYRDYPQIIFISSMRWTQLAKYPDRFRTFVARSGYEGRKFWSTMNITMHYRVTNSSTPVKGPQLVAATQMDVPEEREVDMQPYQQLLDAELEHEEKMMLENEERVQEQIELKRDVDGFAQHISSSSSSNDDGGKGKQPAKTFL